MAREPEKILKLWEEIENAHILSDGDGKNSIGHGIEHIRGVVMRALEFCKIMNEHPEEYELSKPLDPLVVGTAAMAHDLGNVIYRDGHNHLGYAIIKGEFNLQDFLDVPVKNGETKEYLDDISKQEFMEAVETNGYYFSKKDIEHFPVALEYLTTQIFFNVKKKKKT